jgi:hypothetical protein
LNWYTLEGQARVTLSDRMRRIVTIFAAVAAAILFIATIANPWYSFRDGVRGQADIAVVQGRVEYDTIRSNNPNGSSPREFFAHRLHFVASAPGWKFLPAYRGNRLGIYVAIPLWPFALGLAALSFVTHRRSPRNACRHCRYDLRGLPPTTPCPECGAPPAA